MLRGYNVYQVLAEASYWFIIESGYIWASTQKLLTVTELTSSTDYTFIVKAKDKSKFYA
jgi:hypothetical protein